VVTRLLAAGAEVAVMDDFSRGTIDNLASAVSAGLDDGTIWKSDVKSDRAAALIEAWRPTVIVHLAAQASLPESIRSPSRDADANITGTTRLLEAAAHSSVRRVVYAASSAVYGRVSADQLPIDEFTPIAPCSPYGLSKATALAYLDWFGVHYGISTIALALGNVYGPGQGNSGGVIGRFIAALQGGHRPTIYGDGTQTRDFVYVGDIADAFCRASFMTCGGLINVGTGIETSIRHTLDLVADVVGIRNEPIHVEPIPGEPHRFVLAPNGAWAQLGWTAGTPLIAGIRTMAAVDPVHEGPPGSQAGAAARPDGSKHQESAHDRPTVLLRGSE
jgi:UDP-glucose 4-epimerase